MKPLLVSDIIRHASQYHSTSGIVTYTNERKLSREYISYADLEVRSKSIAYRLTQEQQSQFPLVIGTMAWNNSRHAEIAYGVMGSGNIFHPINPRFSFEQLVYIISHADNNLIFYNKELTSLVTSLKDECKNVWEWIDIDSPDYIRWVSQDTLNWTWPVFEENRLASLCYTSGTTGNPKGVAYSHRTILLYAMCSSLPDSLCISSSEVIYPYVNIFHVNAWGLLFSTILSGAKMVLSHTILLKSNVLQIIQKEQVTFSAAVPTFWNILFEELGSEISISPLKRVLISGSACSTYLTKRFNDRQVSVIQTWGMTELGSFGTSSFQLNKSTEELNNLALSQGSPLVGMEFKIIDETQDPSLSSSGKLYTKGYWVLDRYYKQDNTCLNSDGFFYTGDIATIDSNSLLYIQDRDKDIIKIGGEWVSSIHIENIVLEYKRDSTTKEANAIELVACIGMPDDTWEEIPVVCIQTSTSDTSLLRKEILEYLEQKLSQRYIPREVYFIPQFPLTATGKIQKKKLREELRNLEN